MSKSFGMILLVLCYRTQHGLYNRISCVRKRILGRLETGALKSEGAA